MALTKADIATKIADDCGFLKGEATRDCGENPRYSKKLLDTGGRCHDFGFWQMDR